MRHMWACVLLCSALLFVRFFFFEQKEYNMPWDMRVVPLFETLQDLEQSSHTMRCASGGGGERVDWPEMSQERKKRASLFHSCCVVRPQVHATCGAKNTREKKKSFTEKLLRNDHQLIRRRENITEQRVMKTFSGMDINFMSFYVNELPAWIKYAKDVLKRPSWIYIYAIFTTF